MSREAQYERFQTHRSGSDWGNFSPSADDFNGHHQQAYYHNYDEDAHYHLPHGCPPQYLSFISPDYEDHEERQSSERSYDGDQQLSDVYDPHTTTFSSEGELVLSEREDEGTDREFRERSPGRNSSSFTLRCSAPIFSPIASPAPASDTSLATELSRLREWQAELSSGNLPNTPEASVQCRTVYEADSGAVSGSAHVPASVPLPSRRFDVQTVMNGKPSFVRINQHINPAPAVTDLATEAVVVATTAPNVLPMGKGSQSLATTQPISYLDAASIRSPSPIVDTEHNTIVESFGHYLDVLKTNNLQFIPDDYVKVVCVCLGTMYNRHRKKVCQVFISGVKLLVHVSNLHYKPHAIVTGLATPLSATTRQLEGVDIDYLELSDVGFAPLTTIAYVRAVFTNYVSNPGIASNGKARSAKMYFKTCPTTAHQQGFVISAAKDSIKLRLNGIKNGDNVLLGLRSIEDGYSGRGVTIHAAMAYPKYSLTDPTLQPRYAPDCYMEDMAKIVKADFIWGQHRHGVLIDTVSRTDKRSASITFHDFFNGILLLLDILTHGLDDEDDEANCKALRAVAAKLRAGAPTRLLIVPTKEQSHRKWRNLFRAALLNSTPAYLKNLTIIVVTPSVHMRHQNVLTHGEVEDTVDLLGPNNLQRIFSPELSYIGPNDTRMTPLLCEYSSFNRTSFSPIVQLIPDVLTLAAIAVDTPVHSRAVDFVTTVPSSMTSEFRSLCRSLSEHDMTLITSDTQHLHNKWVRHQLRWVMPPGQLPDVEQIQGILGGLRKLFKKEVDGQVMLQEVFLSNILSTTVVLHPGADVPWVINALEKHLRDNLSAMPKKSTVKPSEVPGVVLTWAILSDNRIRVELASSEASAQLFERVMETEFLVACKSMNKDSSAPGKSGRQIGPFPIMGVMMGETLERFGTWSLGR